MVEALVIVFACGLGYAAGQLFTYKALYKYAGVKTRSELLSKLAK